MTFEAVFQPLIPFAAIAAFAAFGLALIVWGAVRSGGAWAWRLGALALMALALTGPRAAREHQTPERDVALLVIDESESQSAAGRTGAAERAAAEIIRAAEGFDDLDLRVVRFAGGGEAENGGGLAAVLTDRAAAVSKDLFAGAVIITDGQINGMPETPPDLGGPVHVLLSGRADETDRRLLVEGAPGYAIVDTPFPVRVRVDDLGAAGGEDRPVVIRVRRNGADYAAVGARTGRPVVIHAAAAGAGAAVFDFSVEPLPGEVSELNNRALVSVNGVRDRLRVLLVSGQPHNGERTWRNLLKSDPAVDLVHFTILRPPEKDDFTPLNELALITFPVRELFEEKLSDFDLVIFDRYIVRDVLPPSYMRNIARYLEAGGALLFAAGPELAGPRGLHRTPLGAVMPAAPTGRVLEGPFRPALSEYGLRHPVTAGLRGSGADGSGAGGSGPGGSGAEPARWGRWFRQIDAEARRGRVLMTGLRGRPLLVLDRAGEGRVAQFLSDQIWLWARGYDGGGPHAETMRRLAHWLMREPDLEEESLTAEAGPGGVTVTRRTLKLSAAEPGAAARAVEAQLPDGTRARITLTPAPKDRPGVYTGALETDQQGLFTFRDGRLTALAARGARDAREFADLRASAAALAPLAEANGGAVVWLDEDSAGAPRLRRTAAGRDAHGRGHGREWIGLKRGGVTRTAGVTETPLIPGWLLAALGCGLMLLAWRRESR